LWPFVLSWVLCRPFGTRLLILSLPGTDVPGYRLYRPYGTGLLGFLTEGFSAAQGHKGQTWATYQMFARTISSFRHVVCRAVPTGLASYPQSLPGAAVPGYRLCRPCGTAWLGFLTDGFPAERPGLKGQTCAPTSSG
jgi:hypothetical protein